MNGFDAHSLGSILVVALAGGIVGLDRTALGQFMISQPIVAAPLAGLLLGDPIAGLVIGAVLELIWVLDIPVGTFVPADSTIAAVSATAIAVLSSGGKASLDSIGFSLLATTAMLPVTMVADGVIRTFNSRLAEAPLAAPAEQAGALLAQAQLKGLLVFFLKSFILYLVFIPVGLIAAGLFARFPEKVHQAMALFVKLLPLLGAAVILRKLSIKTLDSFFLAGFVIAAVLTMVFQSQVMIIVLVVVGAGFIGARYREGWS